MAGKRMFGKSYHMISAYLDEETYQLGKQSHITWSHLIKMGLLSGATQSKFNILMLKYEELAEKQRRTADLLGKYAGGDNNVLD